MQLPILHIPFIGQTKKIKGRWEKFFTKEELNKKIPNNTMYEEIASACEKFYDLPAINYYGKVIKYNKFIKIINKTSNAFYNIGIRKGDVVSICMPNTPEAITAVYALNKIGAIASMIHPLSGETEIKNYINEGKSEYLITIDLDYEKISNIEEKTALKKIICVSAADSMPLYMKVGYFFTKKHKYKNPIYNNKYIKWNTLIRKFGKDIIMPDPSVDGDYPAVILHSGGTTGKPKGIVNSNKSFAALIVQGETFLKRLEVGDKCLTIMPIFHGFGIGVTMHTAYALGVQTILLPTFDAKRFDVLLDKHHPNVVMGVPTLFEALLNTNKVKNLDLSCIKYIVSGGDKLNPSLEDRINSYLKEHNCEIEIAQGYGMTEAMSAVSCDYKEVHKKGSIGIPFLHNQIQIIDPVTRKEVKPNESGEICICGPTVMMGYLNNEEETNEMLQIHKDGHIWLHTGDMGHMDEDGFLFYDQRIKRMIISSGYNVYPQHVEEIIESHPAVLQCTVVGMPHKYKMEVGKAFIVLKEGYHPSIFTKNDIKAFCKKHLAHYECPYKYVYRKSLPKTLLGKIDFKSLQDDENGDDIYEIE